MWATRDILLYCKKVECPNTVRNLLCFIAAYNLFDAVLMIFVNALKGAGDTRYILRVSIVMSASLAGCSWLAVVVLHTGIYACWAIFIGWICSMALLFFWRYQTGKWRTMRVIVPHHTPTLHGDVGQIEPVTAVATSD